MFSKNNRTYRWIKVDYIFLINPSSGKKSLFINATDIDEMKLKEEALINKTKIDDLTGLLNRSTFISEYNHHRSIPRANNNSIIVLVVIDLDFFRNVIRKVGHKTSDDYIVKAANTLKAFAKEENYIARFSEDEFIMFSDTVEDINILNERLRILNNSLNISLNKSETITASIGVAIDKKYSLTFEEMLKMADKAVFKAKSLGGNTSVIFDEKLRKEPWPVISDSEINPNSTKPVIRTFGYFDVFINNKAVLFNHSKAKELLALLIDRKGGFIEPGEAISFLWEDSPHDSVAMSRYRKVAMQLKNTLEKYGIADIIEYKNSMRRVIPELVDCDMYKYLSGLPEYSNLFKGFYMMNYSWSEITTAELEQVK
jgi:diguanylate cyclase (GGDEF)-like protein